MNKKIVITGATGLIGRKLSEELIKDGNRVTVVSRSIEKASKLIPGAFKYINWDYKNEAADFVNGQDVIIHLMGENIMSKRWTDDHKKNVFDSRIKSTEKIIEGIKSADSKPSLFIHSSAIGYYGNGNYEADETSAKGGGFLADVVDAWEKEAAKVEEINVRRVSIRLG
ncbi:MAG: NAD-dependent epimerase/dehydratase family protein, partial [Ignavibacteria bacterium]|nr:NAD-dependent epimerase/dehydratase family protein [Ignavibacteria bacterium]